MNCQRAYSLILYAKQLVKIGSASKDKSYVSDYCSNSFDFLIAHSSKGIVQKKLFVCDQNKQWVSSVKTRVNVIVNFFSYGVLSSCPHFQHLAILNKEEFAEHERKQASFQVIIVKV